MAYVAVKGGKEAIEASLKRLRHERAKAQQPIATKSLISNFRVLIDQAMSEASLYAPELAALAMKQGEGSLEEMVFLLRAFRSTLPRSYYTTVTETSTMDVRRRISASFKDIPGGQILGSSYDYAHRLLDFSLMSEDEKTLQDIVHDYMSNTPVTPTNQTRLILPKVSTYLVRIGFLNAFEKSETPPKDITKQGLTFPTTRSERLQVLTRGMTQSVISLGYASLRGYGSVHPTVGELRVGNLPLYVNPYQSTSEDDHYYIGEVKVTEVESLIPKTHEDHHGKKSIQFAIGYGFVFGQNESKAIAMSILDQTLESKDARYATGDEEFVLYHIDAVEATGFISHLKLPHYVTFQAKLNDLRKIKGVSYDD